MHARCLTLGLAYYNREGVEKDLSEAANLFLDSAKLVMARNVYLGVLCEQEKNVAQKYGKAISCYLEAAGGGNVSAMCRIVTLYEKRLDKKMNNTDIRDWHRHRKDAKTLIETIDHKTISIDDLIMKVLLRTFVDRVKTVWIYGDSFTGRN